MGRSKQSYLAWGHRFKLYRLGRYQYLRSCRRLEVGFWVVFQLVFLVVQFYQELQWGWDLCTMGCWRIFLTCCLRSIRKLGWMEWYRVYNRLSSRNLRLLSWFLRILIQRSWRFFHPSCCSRRSFAWHRGWKQEERVLWFVLLLKYRLRINLEERQSWG